MVSGNTAPYGDLIPMVALVTGADSVVGQRVALALAMNGARLVYLGRVGQRDTMAQVARRASCLGCPSADIHEIDLTSALQHDGGSDEGYTPPTESLHSAVETVLSRQGRVDIIVTCPHGPLHEMPFKLSNQEQLATAKTITGLLATSFLAPPSQSMRAAINIMHPNNKSMRNWAQDLPAYLAAEAANDCTGDSGPTADGMSDLQRKEAAQQVLVASILLPGDKAEDTRVMCSQVSGAVTDVLSSWLHSSTEAPQSKLQHHPKEILIPSSTCNKGYQSSASLTAPAQGAMAELTHSPQEQGAVSKSVVKGMVHAVKFVADRALSPMGDHDSVDTGASATAGASPALTNTTAGAAAGTSAEQVLNQLVRLVLHGSSANGSQVPPAGEQLSRRSFLSLSEQEALLDQLEVLLRKPPVLAHAEAGKVTGCDPSPRPGATCRAHSPSSAVWLKSITPPVGGILLATGARAPPGPLVRRRTGPEELVKAAAALPGAVIIPADPHNLEPEAGRAYEGDPSRHPSLLVQCFKPFNGETPHQVLSDEFITPAELFYVRNHLPVPTHLTADGYRFELSGPGIPGAPLTISLEDLKAGRWGPVVQRQVTLQCAGNRRAEVAAVKLVEGRAPWNHGSIGNAVWTGVDVAQVLLRVGFKPNGDEAAKGADLPSSIGSASLMPQHVVFEGWDYHHQSGTHFEVSIALGKVLGAGGGVMLAWDMNGQELLPDHGYPVSAK